MTPTARVKVLSVEEGRMGSADGGATGVILSEDGANKGGGDRGRGVKTWIR